MNNYSILVAVVLNRVRNILARTALFALRISIVRLGLIAAEAVLFSLQARSVRRRSRMASIRMSDAGEATLDMATVQVVQAEQTANARGVEELWYEIAISRDSSAMDSIHDLFALVRLSSRATFFSIAFAEGANFPIPEIETLDHSSGSDHVHAPDQSPAARLANFASLDQVLGKPFFQSEIAPNDYLKRVSEGRKIVLISVSGQIFDACWEKIARNALELIGGETGGQFLLVDVPAIPTNAARPAGLTIQLLHPLGFTSLERLALAKKVDYLITDRALYVLAASTGNVTVLIPRLSKKEGGGVELEFSIARTRN